MTATIAIPKRVDARIRKELAAREKKGNGAKLYWDYRDEIDADSIEKALEYVEKHPDEYALSYIEESVVNYEAVWDAEIYHLADVLDDLDLIDYFAKKLDLDEDRDNLKLKVAGELRDEYLDYLGVDYNLKTVLNRTDVNVRLEMYSNYDCINSHWYETECRGYTYEESYFGDVIRLLRINPKDMKAYLIKRGYNPSGRWPNKPHWKPLVDLDKFWVEIENRSCGANLLTFIGNIKGYDLLDNYDRNATVIIPKGQPVSFFSSMYGGGSIFECETLYDLKIELGAKDYPRFGLHIDNGGYSINSVYGVTNSFWGGNLQIIKPKNK